LKKLGLGATSTIRENRIKEKNVIDKKAPRRTLAVKHDVNSSINYISIKDSKIVVSTADGITSLKPSQRFSSEKKSRVDIPFPSAFHNYNKVHGWS